MVFPPLFVLGNSATESSDHGQMSPWTTSQSIFGGH
jgi:hypothetical protein